jgi:nucleotide-binding universal stress UspA family protein
MGYRSVVVGTDGSKTAEVAVRHAGELAGAFGARLTVVSAYTPLSPDEVAKRQQEAPAELRWMLTDSNQAEGRARKGGDIAKEAGARQVDVRVASGDPAEVFLDVAGQKEADLIVVGDKGMTSAGRFLLGSVPNKISHHSPCDLVIVRTSG